MPPTHAAARRLAPLLAALAMLGPFSIDTFFPAFRAMEAQFAVGSMAMQQTISIYLGAYAVMSLLHGPLSDSYGRRPVILISTALFAAASLGCALSPSFTSLLIYRAAQGFAAGAGLIVGRAMIRDQFQGPDAQRLMAQVSLIFGVAPAIAPIVGGWMLLWSGWRSIFGLLAGFSVVVWIWCLVALPETLPRPQRQAFSARKLVSTYRRMLQDRCFVALAVTTAGNFGGLFVYVAAAPVFVMNHLGLSEQEFAWLFIPAIGGMMLGSAISGRIAGRRNAEETLQLAYLLMAAGAVSNLLLSYLVPAVLPWAVLTIALGSVGMALAFPTITLLMLDRYPAQRGAASSVQSMVILVANALLAGLTVSLVSHSLLGLAGYAAASMLLGYGAWRYARARLGTAAPICPAESSAAP